MATVSQTRREFLKGTAWMGAAALAAGGCVSRKFAEMPGTMLGFAVPPMKKVRVGFVGLGSRGLRAPNRVSLIPGVEVTALCDIRSERIDMAKKWLAEHGKPTPKGFTGGEDCWKRMCEWDGVDVIYNVLPWKLHACVAVYAMKHGKHVFVEVPAAMYLDECWEVVETAESTRRHCMQLENCCYKEVALLEQNLCRQGVLGEIVHAEGSYLHDLRSYFFRENQNYEDWRIKWNMEHKGDQYPTHGLGPIAKCLDINHGDVFETLVSLGSDQFGVEEWMRENLPADDPRRNWKVDMGDLNVTTIRTAKGRVVTVKHDVTNPRPKSETYLIQGTRGVVAGYPFRIFLNASSPKYAVKKWPDDAFIEEQRQKWMHPLWRDAAAVADKVGGHGGIDFLMDLRWAYCLQNGFPLDMDVYDLASWCAVCELSDRSVRSGGMPQHVPDFTRGGWRTARPPDIQTVDLKKIGLTYDGVAAGAGYKGV